MKGIWKCLVLLAWLSPATSAQSDAIVQLSERLMSVSVSQMLGSVAPGLKAHVRTAPPAKLEYTVRMTHPGEGQPVLETLANSQELASYVNAPVSRLSGVSEIAFTILIQVETSQTQGQFLASFDPNSMKIRTFAANGTETGHGRTLGAVLDFLKARGFDSLTRLVLTRYLGEEGSEGKALAGGLLSLSNAGQQKIGISINPGQVNELNALHGLNLSMHYEPLVTSGQKVGFIQVETQILEPGKNP